MPFHLAVYNLLAHKMRTLLTLGSLTIAIFLVCFLRTVLGSLEAGVTGSAGNRLIVQSAVSLFVDLPIAYQTKIEQVKGIEQVMKMQWFGGIYQEPSNFFAQFGIDHEKFLDTYPEVELISGSQEAFLKGRTACIIGYKLAERFGFKIGDRVPIIGTIFPKGDGTAWEFEVAGIYKSKSANVDDMTLWFHFEYLNETLRSGGASGPDGCGVFVLRVAPKADPVEVSRAVDELFENGPQRVQTTTEAEFQRQFVSMLGSVPVFLSSIGGGVLFAILLAVLNTMLMSARQRTREFGVLKALGFTDATAFSLLLFESLFLCGLGGAFGVWIAVSTEKGLGEALAAMVPIYKITPETMGMGMGVALLLGLLAGIGPAIQASRVRCVEALRAEA